METYLEVLTKDKSIEHISLEIKELEKDLKIFSEAESILLADNINDTVRHQMIDRLFGSYECGLLNKLNLDPGEDDCPSSCVYRRLSIFGVSFCKPVGDEHSGGLFNLLFQSDDNGYKCWQYAILCLHIVRRILDDQEVKEWRARYATVTLDMFSQ